MGHSEAIHARRYLVEQTAEQLERGMALQKALDEGRAVPAEPDHASPVTTAASQKAPAEQALPEGITPELLEIARQLLAIKGG